MTDRPARPTVVMTGATGFIGSALRRALARDFRIVGLTRSAAVIPPTSDGREAGDGTEWRNCDLYSLLELEQALQGADYAIYLANSRLPSARLVQGRFADIDLIMADNFARAAQSCGLKQIIYLGGLIPSRENLPTQLASRIEVERTLGSGTTPLTTLRAGLIVGPSGSSVRIVTNLVRRLPVMVLPEWTLTPQQPIAIDDVVRAVHVCLGVSAYFGGRYDIGGPEVLTFRAMLECAASVMGRRCVMLNVPYRSAALSKLWVTMLGGASHFLVGSLVDSLRYPMVAATNPLQTALQDGAKSFEVALRESIDERGAALGASITKPRPRMWGSRRTATSWRSHRSRRGRGRQSFASSR